jgi:hypothetical protein
LLLLAPKSEQGGGRLVVWAAAAGRAESRARAKRDEESSRWIPPFPLPLFSDFRPLPIFQFTPFFFFFCQIHFILFYFIYLFIYLFILVYKNYDHFISNYLIINY